MKKTILLLLSLILAFSAYSQQRGRPYISNGTVVTDEGNRMRGCYIFTDYYHKDPSEIRDGTKEGIYKARDEYGMNAFHFYCGRGGSDPTPTGTYEPLADSIVKWTREAGVYLIMTLGAHNSYDTEHIKDIWEFYAPKYADETHVIYEIKNEPQFHCNDPLENGVIDMEIQAYNIIRSHAPETHVMVLSESQVVSTVSYLESDLQKLKDGGVDFSNVSVAYHGYYWCSHARARADNCCPQSTEANIIPQLQAKGYAFMNTEFNRDLTLKGDINTNGELIEFYENHMEMSWLCFYSFPEIKPGHEAYLFSSDTDFKNEIDALSGENNVTWCPDYGTWPQNASNCGGTVTKYDLTINKNPSNGGTVTGAGEYNANATATATAEAATGYAFDNWSGASTSTETSINITMDDDKTLTANFSTVAEGDGSITVRAKMINGSSDKLELRLDGNTEHTWTVNSNSYANYTYSGITGSHNVKIYFQDNGTDMQVDYIKVGETTYQAEDQATNTSQWTSNGGCNTGGYSELMHCPGYIDFGSIDFGSNNDAPEYTLTVSKNPSVGGTVTGAGDYDENTTATATASPATGYNFDNWSGASTSTETSVDIYMDGEKSLTANFSLKSYSLTTALDPSGSGSINLDPDQASYDHGTEVTATITENSGYIFDNWSGASTSTETSIVITMDGNKSLTANFSTVAEGDGSITVRAKMINGSSDKLELRLDGNTEHTWTVNSNSYANYTYSGITGSHNVKIYFQDNGTDMQVDYIKVGETTYQAEDQATNTSQWTSNGGCNTGGYSELMHCPGYIDFGSIDFGSNNDAPEYTLTVSKNPSVGGTVTGAGDYDENTTATATASPATGYNFDNWSGASTSTETSVDIYMDGEKSLTANFSLKSYSLTTALDPSGSGSINLDPDQASYDHGTEVTATITENSGYIFDNWSGASTSTETSIVITMDGNKSLTANLSTVGNEDPLSVTLNPVDDAYVKNRNGGGNYGNDTDLQVYEYNNGKLTETYMKFDLSSLLSSGTVTSAKVRMYVDSWNSGQEQEVRVVNDNNWDESTITWDNRPTNMGSVISTHYVTQKVWDEIEFNSNGLSALETALGGEFSINIKSSTADGGTFTKYLSSESGSVPELVINGSGLKSTEENSSFVKMGSISMVIYPNPMDHSDELNLKLVGFSNEVSTMKVYNVAGNLIFNKELNTANKSSFTIDLPDLYQGVYMISIEGKNNVVTEKLFIK